MKQTNIIRNLLALLDIKGIGPGKIKKNFCELQKIYTKEDAFPEINLLFKEINSDNWKNSLYNAEKYIDKCNKNHIKAIAFNDPLYPFPLKELTTAPPVIFCRGNLSILEKNLLGIIGTRNSTPFGNTVANRVGSFFSKNNIHICNGLADGIDMSAITEKDSVFPGTTGIMASGLDMLENNLTSKKLTKRAEMVLDKNGLLISELPPGTIENQNLTISACRIQAGISKVLLMIQSGMNGGSRFTVSQFSKLSRTFAYIVPPEKYLSDQSFEANFTIYNKKEGLATFLEVKKSSSIKMHTHPILSKNDYNKILKDINTENTSLI